MKKLYVVGWLLMLAGMAVAQCPIKAAGEKIVKPLICLDTLGRSVTPDSAHITTYKDDATYATYFARSTTYPFTAASIDTTRPPIGGTAPVLYWLSETISNIDGTASNATLAINVQLWWKGYATDNMFCVQMVGDSLNDVIWKLAALTAGPLEPTTAGRKLDVNAGGEAGLDFDNTSGTLAKTTDITGFNDIAATAVVSSGAITTSGGAVSTVTTTTNLTTNNDKTGYALTSSYPDSAAQSRIARRMWGVQLGASGSSDSLTAAQRQSALSPSGARLGVNTLELNGTSQTARDIGASVLLSSGTGTGQLSLSSGTVTVGTNNDKTGYALTTSYPDSAGLSRILGRKLFGIAAGTGSDSLTKAQRITGASPALDSINTFTYAPDLVDLIWDEDSTGHYTSPNMAYTAAQTGSSTGADSGVVSRIVKRHVGGIQLGTSGSSDSLTLAQRQAAFSPSGSPLNANTTQLSGDGTAADNSESFFDGTGYAGTNNVIPTVTTLTNKTGFSLASTGSDADTGIVALKTKLTTIAGYTDDIGTAGAGLTSVRLGARGTDSDTGFIAMKTKITTITTHTTEMHDSLDTQGWAATGSGGGGTVTTYPSLERIAIVDGVGAIPKFQFVIDTTAIGGSSEYALLNKAVMVRDADDGKWFGRGVIERVNCVSDLCTLQVSDSLPFAVEVGDSVFVKGDEPVYVFASLYEAAAAVASTSLEGTYADSTLGGLLKLIAEGAGASGFDSTLFLEMMQAHGWYATFDSLGLRVTRGNSFSLPLAGDLYTQTQVEAFSMNVGTNNDKTGYGLSGTQTFNLTGNITGNLSGSVGSLTTNNDKSGYSMSAAGIDAFWDEPKAGHTTAGTYGYYLDSRVSTVSGGVGGDCAGTGSDTTDIFVFAASDSDQFVGVWVTYYVGAERLVAQTDSTGRARFATDGSGSYTAIVSARPFTHDNAYVVEGTVDTIYMEASENAPTLTPVCGTLRNLQGQPIAGAVVTATNQASNIRIDGYTVSRYVVNVTTDQFGRFTLWLYPTATLGGTSYKYNFTAYRGSTLIESVTSITVPDQSECYEIDWTIN